MMLATEHCYIVTVMIEPQQFDVVELLVNLPEHGLRAGLQGAILECYPDQSYEVEPGN